MRASSVSESEPLAQRTNASCAVFGRMGGAVPGTRLWEALGASGARRAAARPNTTIAHALAEAQLEGQGRRTRRPLVALDVVVARGTEGNRGADDLVPLLPGLRCRPLRPAPELGRHAVPRVPLGPEMVERHGRHCLAVRARGAPGRLVGLPQRQLERGVALGHIPRRTLLRRRDLRWVGGWVVVVVRKCDKIREKARKCEEMR
jgi:hypothetical protein